MVEGFKNTEVGIIPSDWTLEPYTEIATLKHGFQFLEGHFSKNGIGVIKIGNLKDGAGLNLSDITYVPFNSLKRFEKFKLKKGDVLMALTGATLGKVCLVDTDITLLQNYRVGNFIPNEKTTREFIYQVCQSEIVQRVVKDLVNSGAQPNLGKKDFDKIFIPLPPTKTEQTAIATALNDADALIQKLEQLIAKKRNIKTGAMQELLKPKEGWEVDLLPDLVWFQEGPGVRKHQFTTSGVKLLNGTNIENGNLYLDKTDKYVSFAEANGAYSHFLVDEGDILIACSGITVEKFHEKVTEAKPQHLPLCMNTSTMRFKIISDRLLKYYFYHFLQSDSFKNQISEQITGSAQLNFGPAHVKWVEIKYPNPMEQSRIAEILTDMDNEIQELETQLEKYKMMKQGMMQSLLTGKIRLV